MIVVARAEIEVAGYGWLDVDGKSTSFLVPGENALPDDIEPALLRKLEIYAERGFIEIRHGNGEPAKGKSRKQKRPLIDTSNLR